jgi:hypothetical protein
MHIAWYEYFQIISLGVAIYCRKGLKACSLGAFIPLLIIVNISELIGINFRAFGWKSNYNVYNIYLLLSTPFFFWLAGKMLFLTKKESLIYYTVCVLCMLFVIVNFLFIQGRMGQFNTYSLGLIEIMMIVFSGLCLVRLTVIDQEEMNFMREPYFWINSLNLLFGLITLVILSMQTYISQNNIEIGHKPLYSAILQPLNAIVYAGYSYAFILCRTQKTR